eukprot:739494_1
MKSLPILPSGLTNPETFLPFEKTSKVTLTQGEVLDLNALGFFGLLEWPFSRYRSQNPNISRLFRGVKAAHAELRQQKIRCIMHYFARMMHMMKTHPNDLTKHHITVF